MLNLQSQILHVPKKFGTLKKRPCHGYHACVCLQFVGSSWQWLYQHHSCTTRSRK